MYKIFSDFFYSDKISKKIISLILFIPLYPLSVIYGLISIFHSSLRALNSKKFKKSKSIVIGNINTGGAGKTPIAKFIARQIIKSDKTCCIVTKGFGKSENKSLLIKKNAQNITNFIGDEPLMFLEICDVFLVNKRQEALSIDGKYDYIIYDDGMHDTSIIYNYKILVIDSQYKFGNCLFLPIGPIRINTLGVSNFVDCIFYMNEKNSHALDSEKFDITNISENLNHSITKSTAFNFLSILFLIFQPSFIFLRRSNRFSILQNLFFNHKAKNFTHQIKFNTANIVKKAEYIAIAGIGINEKFFNTLNTLSNDYNFKIIKKIEFPDHFIYTKDILENIITMYPKARIITTQKDFVKMKLIKKLEIFDKIDFIEIY